MRGRRQPRPGRQRYTQRWMLQGKRRPVRGSRQRRHSKPCWTLSTA